MKPSVALVPWKAAAHFWESRSSAERADASAAREIYISRRIARCSSSQHATREATMKSVQARHALYYISARASPGQPSRAAFTVTRSRRRAALGRSHARSPRPHGRGAQRLTHQRPHDSHSQSAPSRQGSPDGCPGFSAREYGPGTAPARRRSDLTRYCAAPGGLTTPRATARSALPSGPRRAAFARPRSRHRAEKTTHGRDGAQAREGSPATGRPAQRAVEHGAPKPRKSQSSSSCSSIKMIFKPVKLGEKVTLSRACGPAPHGTRLTVLTGCGSSVLPGVRGTPRVRPA